MAYSVFISAHFAKVCFDAGKEEESSDTSWKMDPARKLYRLLRKIYKKIFDAKTTTVHDYHDDATMFETTLVPYSKEYVDYMLCKYFKNQREGYEEGNDAIIWSTKSWRQRFNLGMALRLTFDQGTEVAPITETPSYAVGDHFLSNNITQYTQDKFWTIVDSMSGGARFSRILILKLIVHKICEGTQVERTRTKSNSNKNLTNSTLKNHIRYVSDAIGQDLFLLWDSEPRMLTWLRDKLFTSGAANSNTDLKYLIQKYDGNAGTSSIDNLEWDIALGQISKTRLIQYFQNQEQELVPYTLFDGYTPAQRSPLDNALNTHDLAIALKVATHTGVITQRLIQNLLGFRRIWQKNRYNFGVVAIRNLRSGGLGGVQGPNFYASTNVLAASQFGFTCKRAVAEMKQNSSWKDERLDVTETVE
jgi:hypothetical protein